MKCIKCGREHQDYHFRVLQVQTLHVRDFGRNSRIQALGDFEEYDVCATCAEEKYNATMDITKTMGKTMIIWSLIMVLGAILAVAFWHGEGVLRLAGLGGLVGGGLYLFGAMQAANVFFRRPDLFDQVFAISGVYDSRDAFGDYMDDLVYQNTPVEYLMNMPADHPYIRMYNERQIIIVVGQGAWEDVLKASTGWLKWVLEQKGINATVDFWGHDVDHDWPWWYKMVAHYVPRLLG